MPARSNARAKASDPRQSASRSFLSKCSEPEKRSKTSDGPLAKRPPQSLSAMANLGVLRGRGNFRPHHDRQANQVDESARVLLIVLSAHGEARHFERIERIRRLAADRLDIAFVQ